MSYRAASPRGFLANSLGYAASASLLRKSLQRKAFQSKAFLGNVLQRNRKASRFSPSRFSPSCFSPSRVKHSRVPALPVQSFPIQAFVQASPAQLLLEGLGLGLVQAILQHNPWSTQRLAAFAGKTVSFELLGEPAAVIPALRAVIPHRWPSLPLLRIARDGYLERAASDANAAPPPPDVRLSLTWSPALLQDLPLRDPKALLSHLRIEGDVLLAAALGEALRDIEVDIGGLLAPITGDILAQRADHHGRQLFAALSDNLSALGSAIRRATGSTTA